MFSCDVAQGTVKALQLKLRPEEQAALAVHGTDQPAAYKYLLQARGYLVDYTKKENVENAVVMAGEALKLDPNFGQAKAVLGEAYWRKYQLTRDPRWPVDARASCARALELADRLAAAHLTLGVIDLGTGRTEDAVTELAQLGPALREALSGGRPSCINVRVALDPPPPETRLMMGDDPFR